MTSDKYSEWRQRYNELDNEQQDVLEKEWDGLKYALEECDTSWPDVSELREIANENNKVFSNKAYNAFVDVYNPDQSVGDTIAAYEIEAEDLDNFESIVQDFDSESVYIDQKRRKAMDQARQVGFLEE